MLKDDDRDEGDDSVTGRVRAMDDLFEHVGEVLGKRNIHDGISILGENGEYDNHKSIESKIIDDSKETNDDYENDVYRDDDEDGDDGDDGDGSSNNDDRGDIDDSDVRKIDVKMVYTG
ncbi:phosphopantothenoylcysteine decarboxylase subunit VHS3-like [Neodiprion fabricii]|uniref:phosphopantothenoylcysteine decarboxylase subunit VHS3-like n=1 Tax=Neodiprion fabricii TaxID=2872261 RepID=UPI001ED8F057|nr:phosphopantothenoylcysteine decarboxylase subunit VHS3-like [Neodiprion fabricii]